MRRRNGRIGTLAFLLSMGAAGCESHPIADRPVVSGDVDVCPVHDTTLRRETRPINYGLQTFSQAWFEDAPRLFPLANTYIGGGCVSFEGEDTRTRVKYCEECRMSQSDWFKAHPKDWSPH